ncbi:FMN-dependent NADH-azoreductase [Streptomyces sp. RKND-216]|uniref:FMN-dependent NADH-azoreductase n=1 Tax=Streptomyces sp. RKND-216 TaxID=2562581 RepID=UPI00109DF288|nr:NAD(P)H-dependent oxidoreductase [Streptomyces sp. RKND-216]THA25433.1 FMN-dependent NADH-azoreductase [Streptomyces sp. RKND-216]
MATLLHIDSSLNGDRSHSRAVTAAFTAAWREEHPDGTVIYRDLAADPVPHIDATAYYAGYVAPGDRSPEQQEASVLREQLIEEAESADVIVLGAPLYNWSIASGLKAWLDHVIAVGRTTMTESPTLAGKHVIVITSRGGSYRHGTPEEGNDHLEPYLQMVLADKLGMKPEFILPELTLAPVTPAMASLVPQFEESREDALAAARAQGRELAARLGA